MVRMSTLADCLKTMTNAEKRGKRQALIRPASSVIIRVLKVMQKHGYIGDFEVVDNHRSNKIVVELNGRINKCGVVSPRYAQACHQRRDWLEMLMDVLLFLHFFHQSQSTCLTGNTHATVALNPCIYLIQKKTPFLSQDYFLHFDLPQPRLPGPV